MKIINYAFLLAGIMLISACVNSQEQTMANRESTPNASIEKKTINTTVTGTVLYKQLEGGFFALISNDNKYYTLRKLPEEFKLEGLVVEISGVINKDIITFTQFGELLEVESVKVIDNSNAKAPDLSAPKLKRL